VVSFISKAAKLTATFLGLKFVRFSAKVLQNIVGDTNI